MKCWYRYCARYVVVKYMYFVPGQRWYKTEDRPNENSITSRDIRGWKTRSEVAFGTPTKAERILYVVRP
jgi:hypothetical protein